MNVNSVHLLGRTTKDPIIRATQSGSKVATFSLATNHIWKNAQGEKIEEVDFHNIVAFGRNAEIIEQYVTKGQLLYVEGRIKNSSYEDKEGNKKYRTDIIVSSFQLGPKPQGEKTYGPGDQANTNQEIDSKDIPY